MTFSRRQFIKIGLGSAGAATVGSGLTTEWWGADRHKIVDPGTAGDHVVPTFCELCFWKCGVLAHVKDGKVTKIEGNPVHPLSRGKLCPRGTGGTGLLYDPDRLKVPLVRKEKRGDQVFEAVSWSSALDVVAENLDNIRTKYGPEALSLFSHGFGGSWFKHLVQSYGSNNIAAPSYAQCRGPREVGYYLTFGNGVGSPETVDIANSRCITLMGCHLGENMHNTQVQDFADALGSGAELVVVDPRFSTAAGKAKYWLPIKPGTDIALLLAWMHVIINENRYDKAYIDKHAVGFEELKQHVADKTPDWAYAHTGIRPELIVETARFIAGHAPASLIHPGRRATWYGDDTQRSRAMAILAALLGSWGRRGGYVLPTAMSLPKYPYPANGHAPGPKRDKPEPSLYPLADETLASGLCDATIPGQATNPIKAWMVYGTNLMQSLPNPTQTAEAIQALDFIVSIDVLPAEICGWSDVVLPECTYLERDDDLWAPAYKEPFVAMRQKVVEPMFESKPGWWIAKQLASRLGLEQHFPWTDASEYVEHRAKTAGLDIGTLRTTGVVHGEKTPVTEEEGIELAFHTTSGKIELKSETLASAGFHALPEYVPHEEPPAGMFRLLTGRAPMHTFGRTTNNRFLSQVYDENEVWVNEDVVRSLPQFAGVPPVTGDRVVLVNQDGVRSEPVKLKVTQRIRGDAVYMVHGYGHTSSGLKFAYRRGASDSQLTTRYKVDPIMGGTGMSVNFVSIEPVETAEVDA